VGSAWYLFLLPFIGILSLGILLPLALKGMREYIARNYRFGAARFSGRGQLGQYYGAGAKTLLLAVLLIGIVTGLAGLAIYNTIQKPHFKATFQSHSVCCVSLLCNQNVA
jgi:uncharacterized membrane protein YjgN (DUF898 family)